MKVIIQLLTGFLILTAQFLHQIANLSCGHTIKVIFLVQLFLCNRLTAFLSNKFSSKPCLQKLLKKRVYDKLCWRSFPFWFTYISVCCKEKLTSKINMGQLHRETVLWFYIQSYQYKLFSYQFVSIGNDCYL